MESKIEVVSGDVMSACVVSVVVSKVVFEAGLSGLMCLRWRKRFLRLSTGMTLMSGIREACLKLDLGRKMVVKLAVLAASTRFMMPFTGCKSPFRDSSPTNAVAVRSEAERSPFRHKMAMAMGKSR